MIRKVEERNQGLDTIIKMNQSSKMIEDEGENFRMHENVVVNHEERILDPDHSKYRSPSSTFNMKEKQIHRETKINEDEEYYSYIKASQGNKKNDGFGDRNQGFGDGKSSSYRGNNSKIQDYGSYGNYG